MSVLQHQMSWLADDRRQMPGFDISGRARLRQTSRRLKWLQDRFEDTAYFDAAVAQGRYLKLCNLLEWASANVDAAERAVQATAPSAANANTHPLG